MSHERENLQQRGADNGEVQGHGGEESRATGSFTSTGAIPPVESGFRSHGPSASERAFGGGHGHDEEEAFDRDDLDATTDDAKKEAEERRDRRFENDPILEEIGAGTRVIKNGDKGRGVTKLQVALLDLGYLKKGKYVDGDFQEVTEKALKKYQAASGVSQTGEFDTATLDSLRAKFESRAPYIALSKESRKGVHALEDYEKAAAVQALSLQTPGATFVDEVAGEKYGPKIEKRLSEVIIEFHANFKAHEAKRADPDTNFHKWKDLEGPCQAAKTVTDKVYGSYKTKPAFSAGKGTLVDYFEDQTEKHKGLDPAEKKARADNLVRYMVMAGCAEINELHNADVDGAAETAILNPIVESFIDTDDKVQIMLDIKSDWPGARRGDKMFLQRYKSDTDEQNRVDLWRLFHTGIHEYLHTLVHEDYHDWANELGGGKKHTLVEGFCEFFTLNVRSQLAITKTLQAKVEGDFHDKDKDPPANADGSSEIGVYDSHAQAEQVVSIVGIRNAQEAYFNGEIDKMGAQ
jgi:peptidoglycan hydrolase-like protein with peptidoglycan-binding domain